MAGVRPGLLLLEEPPQPVPAHCHRIKGLMLWRRERDSNPRYPCGYTGFRDRRLQPLGHLSAYLYLWVRGPLRPAHPFPDFSCPGPAASGWGALSAAISSSLTNRRPAAKFPPLSGPSYFRVHKFPLTQGMSPWASRRAKSRTQGAGWISENGIRALFILRLLKNS